MCPSTAAELLSLWERCQGVSPHRRPLALLAPLEGGEGLEDLSVGERDTLLWRLRERLFGPRLEARAECPSCREPLGFTLSVAALCPDTSAPARGATQALAFDYEGWVAEFRVARCGDLEAVIEAPDAATARHRLLERCLLALRGPGGNPASLAEAPVGLLEALVGRLAEADPAADLRLDLSCPTCDAAWEAPLDASAWLWAELRSSAARLLREVHELARAYGWSEESILDLSPARRRAYLELARA